MGLQDYFSQLPSLRTTIHRFGLNPHKKLGQNFLTDDTLLHHIVSCAGVLEGEHVLEIGPGPGGLTRAILFGKATSLCVIEQDPRCVEALQQLAAYDDRLTIIEGDALKFDEASLFDTPFHIIANLPYHIATQLLLKWLGHVDSIKSMTLMFQKEVADRIMASPRTKSYGRLSVISQWLCDVEHHMDIEPEAFFPPPKVTSSVISLRPKNKRFDADKMQLEKFTQRAFQHRRKTLSSSLKSFYPHIKEALDALDISHTARAEELTIEQFCKLTQELSAS